MDGQPFHAGELAAQARAGLFSRGTGIREIMPDQHREFFALLPCLFAAGLDRAGWPLATVLGGAPGFVTSPSPTELAIAALPAAGDPAAPALAPGRPVGLLGLDFTTRRRNRANGTIVSHSTDGLSVRVRQSFGNCAKYIQSRAPSPAPAGPAATEALSGLDAAARRLIAEADTLFVASRSAAADPADAEVDISHRGGLPGFARLDGEVLSVPDFVGNNYFNTLGNLLGEPRAALLFVDFASGGVLQLQGRVEIVWDGPELARLEGAQRLWRFRVERGWRRSAALPWRWSEAGFAPTTLATGAWRDAAPTIV